MHPTAPRVAFQGVFGAFSHEACVACLPEAEPIPFDSFEAAFAAVKTGDCALAFIPVENSTAGRVPEVAALLPGSGLRVLSEHAWPVRIQLLALPGATLADLTAVASHPMALKQCERFLTAHGLRAEPAYDTAGAARQLAEAGDRTRAAAAARIAAGLYGLEVLAADIHDNPDNSTRFAVLSL